MQSLLLNQSQNIPRLIQIPLYFNVCLLFFFPITSCKLPKLNLSFNLYVYVFIKLLQHLKMKKGNGFHSFYDDFNVIFLCKKDTSLMIRIEYMRDRSPVATHDQEGSN